MNEQLLAEETAFFEEHDRAFQRQYRDRFLLIHGRELIGDYSDEAEAVADGVRKFNRGPFLVRKPGEPEPVLTAPAYTLGLI